MHQFLTSALNVLVVVSSIFLICLVLIQRGKGGGLAGAFGGAGGSSAFGTKAGDVFTRITMITAGVWILMLMVLVIVSNNKPPVWVDDASTRTGAGSSGAGSKDAGGRSLDLGPGETLPLGPASDLAPPPPTGSGSGVTSPSPSLPPVPPPVSGSGPSAPVPVSPAPGGSPAPTAPAPATAPAPKS